MRVSIMKVPYGFKIRKKTDIDTFIHKCMAQGGEYVIEIDTNYAVVFSKRSNDDISVCEKRGNLEDVFNPLIEVARTTNNVYDQTVEYYIWKYRKYINKKWFSIEF